MSKAKADRVPLNLHLLLRGAQVRTEKVDIFLSAKHV